MERSTDSVIIDRLKNLADNSYIPEKAKEDIDSLRELLKDNPEAIEKLDYVIQAWRDDLKESYLGIIKLQDAIVQYQDELVLMMDQMDGLVKCSLMIKQYSFHLKNEIDQIADKIDRRGIDQKIDQLVSILEDIKPRRHLNVVKETQVVDFPKKESEN